MNHVLSEEAYKAYNEWKEMTLRRKLKRIDCDLVKYLYTHKNTGEPVDGSYGYWIEDDTGMILDGVDGFLARDLDLEKAIDCAKQLYKSSGMEYGSLTEPERELDSAEENYVEDQTQRAHDYFYYKALDYECAEIERLESKGFWLSGRHKQGIKKRWNQWVEDMTENARQNFIAECLDEDPEDEDYD